MANRVPKNQPEPSRIEVVFLPGLEGFVRRELSSSLATAAGVRVVPGRDDALTFTYRGSWAALLRLRTVVAAFAVLSFSVPRPRSLTSGEYFVQIASTIDAVRRLHRGEPPRSFRFEAAGSDSAVFQRLAAQTQDQTGLSHDAQDGDIVIRFRRTPGQHQGWDVLVRLSPRPLSDRGWRQANFPGAVNATIAASICLATRPKRSDRVVNLMCGSGTLLIERLMADRARLAVAVDADERAMRACRTNLEAAGLSNITLMTQDIADDGWLGQGPFDVLLADPPWGHLIGDRRNSAATHLLLLQRAAAGAAPDARLAVLTHEIKIMDACLDQVRNHWRLESQTRVFQKGHHPRIYLLNKQG